MEKKKRGRPAGLGRVAGSGRPKFTEEKIVVVNLKVSQSQYDRLRATGNLSATVRRLVDEWPQVEQHP